MSVAWHNITASSMVWGHVAVRKPSVSTVTMALLKSPMTCSLKAAVLLVPSVTSAIVHSLIREEETVGGAMVALRRAVSLRATWRRSFPSLER